MKIRLSTLRRIIKEENVAASGITAGGGVNLNKLLDELGTQFASKMRDKYPNDHDIIQQEMMALKVQLTAQIKASAAKIKMSVSKSS